MRLLLDTHIAIWVVDGSPRLSTLAREIIEAAEDLPYISVAAIWELSIKYALGQRLGDPMPFSGYAAIDKFERSNLDLLAIEPHHAAAVSDLPLLHGDPFDRLMVAQARCEGLRLLTQDRRLAQYGDFVVIV